MKILITLLSALFALAITAQAQTSDVKPQTSQQPSQGDQQMQMGCKMMGGSGTGGSMMAGGMDGMMSCMMSHGAMTHDVLDVVTEMLKIQQKIIEGVAPAEKDALSKEIILLQARVSQMQKTAHSMPMMKHTMPMGSSSPDPGAKQGTPEALKETPKGQMQHQH